MYAVCDEQKLLFKVKKGQKSLSRNYRQPGIIDEALMFNILFLYSGFSLHIRKSHMYSLKLLQILVQKSILWRCFCLLNPPTKNPRGNNSPLMSGGCGSSHLKNNSWMWKKTHFCLKKREIHMDARGPSARWSSEGKGCSYVGAGINGAGN